MNRVVITMEGGCITSVCSDHPLEVAIVDFESDGGDAGYQIANLSADHTPLQATEDAFLGIQSAEIDPAFVEARFKQIKELTCEQF